MKEQSIDSFGLQHCPQGHRSWRVAGVRTPLKVCWKGQSMFWPLEMSPSLIQNCCCITASFTTSRMNTWTLSLHWFCLCWRCCHPYIWSAPTRQSSNQCLCCYTGYPVSEMTSVSSGTLNSTIPYHTWIPIVAKDKTPKRGCRWPAINNPHRWCTSWRSRGVHLPWQ